MGILSSITLQLQSSSLLGLYLHHHFVCALLNDLFGIQARAAGAMQHTHARKMFGIGEERAKVRLIMTRE